MKKDHAQALKWYLLAANQGVAHSQHHAGELLYPGRGIRADRAQSLKWLILAATQLPASTAPVRRGCSISV